jgi:ferredoxin
MGTRNIIKINAALCNGCGNCIIACVEGAIRLANGKAVVISDKFCDGLGACIGGCPEGALSIEKREADEFT